MKKEMNYVIIFIINDSLTLLAAYHCTLSNTFTS